MTKPAGPADFSQPFWQADYAALENAADAFVAEFDRDRADPAAKDRLREPVAGIAGMLTRRGFAAAQERMDFKSDVMRLAVDAFLSSRLGRRHLDYLELREGDAVGEPSVSMKAVESVLRRWFLRLGRRPLITLAFRLRGRARPIAAFDFDPFVDLRAIYALSLRAEKQGRRTWSNRARVALLRARAGLKAAMAIQAAVWFARFYVARLGGEKTRALTGVGGNLGRHALWVLATVFSGRRRWPADDDALVVEAVMTHLSERAEDFFRALLTLEAPQLGLAKMAKIAFGVLVGRAEACPPLEPQHRAQYVVDSVKLAFAWGATYPLIDDVIDDFSQPAELRADVKAVVARFLCGEEARRHPDGAPSGELERCFADIRQVLTAEQLSRTRGWMGHLLRSHQVDTERSLADAAPSPRQLLVDTVLKAALVRLTTMELCGLAADKDDVVRHFAIGLYNQLGDDLCDVAEDIAGERVTAFTIPTQAGGEYDPYYLYADILAFLADRFEPAARAALAYSYVDGLRVIAADPTLAALSQPGLARMFTRYPVFEPVRALSPSAPYLDLDTVVFDAATVLTRRFEAAGLAKTLMRRLAMENRHASSSGGDDGQPARPQRGG